jgi:hypothetical protein
VRGREGPSAHLERILSLLSRGTSDLVQMSVSLIWCSSVDSTLDQPYYGNNTVLRHSRPDYGAIHVSCTYMIL